MNIDKEIFRLDFENFLWFLFIILSFLNICGDNDDKKYLQSGESYYSREANHIFTFTLAVTFFIYLYFFVRNYKMYEAVSDSRKKLYLIKLLGSSFLIAGTICLWYFQNKESLFVGSPAI